MAIDKAHTPLTPEILRPFLIECGYDPSLLVANYRFGTPIGEGDVALAAFAHQPADARSACVTVIGANGEPEEAVISYRGLGAPVMFVCSQEHLQWWQQRAGAPQYHATLTAADLPGFFREHRQDFAPGAIYRAKTRGRFESDYQLSFVDLGLMNLVEEDIGQALSHLVEQVIIETTDFLKAQPKTGTFGQWLFQSVFWLLAAKILRDKQVPTFRSLNLSNIDEVFSCIAAHYGSSRNQHAINHKEREALAAASDMIDQFSHLGHVTTESLAYLYENTLISKKTRSKLGTHSTPSYLVDYIIWRLAPWIEEIPVTERCIFEPACGHGAFLVSAMRLLKESLPGSTTDQAARTDLRQQLHGLDIDAFAVEIARLSMTLANVPYPDGWHVWPADMFIGNTLEQRAKQATVLLANPPFENFSASDRAHYTQQGFAPTYINKTAEMLHRTLPHLRPGAVFGVVVPQGFLHSKNAAELRAFLSRDYDIAEICLFPDKVFTFSDMESAIILGRREPESHTKSNKVFYRRVREPDIDRFRSSYAATTDRWIGQERFTTRPDASLHVPDLDEIWEWCRHFPRLADLAEVGKGLEYKGRDLPVNAPTLSSMPFPGAVRGFARITPELQIDGQPSEVWMSIDPAVIRRSLTGTVTGVPQVLLNYAPVSRSPWRLKAVIDREGHAVTSNFLTIRPVSTSYPLELFWVLCNSPFANAYVYAHAEKRHVLAGTMRAMPVPRISPVELQRLVEVVHAYLDAVASPAQAILASTLFHADDARTRLMQIDAEILRLYDLPPRLERQLLDLFAGLPRPGVPFTFERYFPEGFEPCLPLHVYLSEDYRRSTAEALRVRYTPVTDPTLLAALGRAEEDFEE